MVLFKDEACFSQEGFSRATTAMFGQKQTLMLHLLTATTDNALWWTFGRALLMTFWLDLVTPTAQCAYLSCVSGSKATRNAGGNPVVSQVAARRVLEHLTATTTIAGCPVGGQWLGLPGHRTSHQRTFSYGAHIEALIYTSSLDSEENLIARILETAANWHVWPRTLVCAGCVVGCISRSLTVSFNIWSK